MKTKDKIITVILCLIIFCFFFIYNSYEKNNDVKKLYKVYLDEMYLGAIDNRDSLYALIDNKQQAIKEKYHVESVFPPNGLEIVEAYSYKDEISNLESIYQKIEEIQDFTIHGYEITIQSHENEDSFNIYVLDKEIFKKAIKEFIYAFIDKNDFDNYILGNQGDLDKGGLIYKNMDILEDIIIKETNISINEKIYEDSNELTQHLLFGFNYKEQNYTIKSGDTIESVADHFELNPQEILIANPKYSSKDSLLTIGDKLMIAYVIPELSFSYTINEMEEVEQEYNKETIRDNTKPSNYNEITQAGVTGLELITYESTLINGELSSTVDIIKYEKIREKVDQITTKGKKSYSYTYETFDNIGSGWTWPTVGPYIVTSEYGYRSLGGGKQHNGIDISGTPWGSNIYAANDGVVTYVYENCPNDGYYGSPCGSGYGNQVVINHGENVYTIYAHIMNDVRVSVGQTVRKGQIIGYMADSGSSTGTHLHFGVSTGDPRGGGKFYNPRTLYR